MVRIRLRRVGGKKQPSYRIVAADKESPRDGRFLEILGFYNPRTQPVTLQFNEGRIFDWMSKGAQPSDSVRQIFQSAGVLERFEHFKRGEGLEAVQDESSDTQEKGSDSSKPVQPAAKRARKKAE